MVYVAGHVAVVIAHTRVLARISKTARLLAAVAAQIVRTRLQAVKTMNVDQAPAM